MSRNKYAGICYRCGKPCAAGEGHFERVTNVQAKKWNAPRPEKWLIQHAACAIKYRGTDVHYVHAPRG